MDYDRGHANGELGLGDSPRAQLEWLGCLETPSTKEALDTPTGEQPRGTYRDAVLSLEQGMLLSWLWKFTRDSRSLEDLLQEVYEQLLRVDETRAASIESVPRYAFGICRNVALDWRHRRRKQRIDYVGAPEQLSTADPQRDVERIVSGQQEITLLIEEIEQLPSRCREILLQVKVFGYSVKEVAEAMDIAESTVKKQLQIAAARCARALEKKQTGPGLQLLSRLVGRRGVRA